jgi:hypothetical protein
MTTLRLLTLCAYCGAQHSRITHADVSDMASPSDGDISLCFHCGEINVVDDGADGGLRKPNEDEKREIEADERVIHLRATWPKVKLQ